MKRGDRSNKLTSDGHLEANAVIKTPVLGQNRDNRGANTHSPESESEMPGHRTLPRGGI